MNDIRELLLTDEFCEYYNSLTPNVKEKFDYVMLILKTFRVVSSKFIKKLEDSEFYEMRVSTGTNEHRTIIFTIDTNSFIESKQVVLLNCFLKKNTKQYKQEIKKAKTIKEKLEDKKND